MAVQFLQAVFDCSIMFSFVYLDISNRKVENVVVDYIAKVNLTTAALRKTSRLLFVVKPGGEIW